MDRSPHAQNNTRRLLLIILALAATTSAQLTDLPNLATETGVLGATATETSESSRDTDMSAADETIASAATATTTQVPTTTDPDILTLTAAPSLYGVGVPPLIVPDTSGAPFMHKTNLPEGFVFICVGAALAFCGLCVLAWRGLVAWSLHRSVKRTASDRYMSEKKSMYGGPPTYSSAYHSADVSMEHLTAKDTSYKGATRHDRQSRSHSKPAQRASRQPTNSNLFFSPTAGVGQNMANRTSSYLPAGYYASSGTTLGSSSMTNLGGHPAAGYGRVDTASDSPERRPVSRPPQGYNRNMSRDRLDIASRDESRRRSRLRTATQEQPGGRAPSAVLDELFEHHTGMR